jgi:DNA transposition AAA+ family ATPase
MSGEQETPLSPMPQDDGPVIWDARQVIRQLQDAETTDDPLEADARVERIPRMTLKDGAEKPLSQDDQILAINNIKRFIVDEHRCTAQRMAKMAGVSPSAVSELLHNRYKGDLDTLLRRCEAAMNEQMRREDAPGASQFVETRVARQIHNILKMTSKLRRISVFYGPSSLGKTMALEASIRLDFPSAILIKCNRGNSTPLKFCQAMLAAICGGRLDVKAVRATGDAFNMIVERLLNSSRLIICDEADCLDLRTLNIIRQIHDATGDDMTRCPVVLAGRPNLARKIQRTTSDEEIGGSLRGRMLIERNLLAAGSMDGDGGGAGAFTVEEVMAILQRNKIRVTRDAAKFLCTLVNVTLLTAGAELGGLRSLTAVATLAVSMFKDKELTPDMLIRAFKLTRDRDTAAVLLNQIGSELKRSPARVAAG